MPIDSNNHDEEDSRLGQPRAPVSRRRRCVGWSIGLAMLIGVVLVAVLVSADKKMGKGSEKSATSPAKDDHSKKDKSSSIAIVSTSSSSSPTVAPSPDTSSTGKNSNVLTSKAPAPSKPPTLSPTEGSSVSTVTLEPSTVTSKPVLRPSSLATISFPPRPTRTTFVPVGPTITIPADGDVPIPTVVLPPENPPGGSTLLVCNNSTGLCDARIDDMLFATVHNAGSTAADNFILPNQKYKMVDALIAGYRGLNVDIGICDGRIGLVHSTCFLGFANLTNALSDIAAYLQQHKNEVIIMPTQLDYDTGGEFTLLDLAEVMPKSFRDLLYEHPTNTTITTPWPTLRELIESNRRILFFHYNGERCVKNDDSTSSSSSTTTTTTCPFGFMNWFDYASESEYSFDTVDALQDKDSACRITRGPNNGNDNTVAQSSSSSSLYGVNVFTKLPNPNNCAILNGGDFVRSHLSSCATVTKRDVVNVLLVDCWDIGDVLQVVNEYNNNRT